MLRGQGTTLTITLGPGMTTTLGTGSLTRVSATGAARGGGGGGGSVTTFFGNKAAWLPLDSLWVNGELLRQLGEGAEEGRQ